MCECLLGKKKGGGEGEAEGAAFSLKYPKKIKNPKLFSSKKKKKKKERGESYHEERKAIQNPSELSHAGPCFFGELSIVLIISLFYGLSKQLKKSDFCSSLTKKF